MLNTPADRAERRIGIMQPQAKADAILRRARRALRDLEADAAISDKEKLGILRAIDYDVTLLAAALEPPSETEDGAGSRFEETRI